METKFDFSQNWATNNFPVWDKVLEPYKGKPTKMIEIGCFEGMSTIWFCDNILKHPDSKIDCVDPYLPYLPDYKPMLDMEAVEKRFHNNIEVVKDKVTLHKELSFDYLKKRTEMADIIYVDGDHSSKGCILDMVLSHQILNKGGMMIVDDYLWAGMMTGLDVPKGAIDAFMSFFAEDYDLISIGYQVILRKK